MKICKIELTNYRNIEAMEILPCDGVNIIYGENAQGKTNIIESIFLFTGLKSFRGAKDSELISFGKPFAKAEAEFYSGGRNKKAVIKIQNRRRASLNGVELKSSRELMGKFNAALFSPDFLSLVQRGPDERRKFIDAAICQLKPNNAVFIAEYNRLIKQRNFLLKEPDKNAFDLIEVIDKKLSMLGDRIYSERKDFLASFIPYLDEIYSGLSGGREKISLSYIKKGVHGEDTDYGTLLKTHKNADIAAKTTVTGVHRDDIEIKINGISARDFGSQGQQRSCAIALKLAEAQILKSFSGEEPVILLDDVMSELDEKRQDYILNHIRDKQVFITCCDPSSIEKLSEGRSFHIKDGKIIK